MGSRCQQIQGPAKEVNNVLSYKELHTHTRAHCMWLTGDVTAHVSDSAQRTLLSRCSVADRVTSLCMQRGMSWNRPLRSTPLRDEEDQRHTR